MLIVSRREVAQRRIDRPWSDWDEPSGTDVADGVVTTDRHATRLFDTVWIFDGLPMVRDRVRLARRDLLCTDV